METGLGGGAGCHARALVTCSPVVYGGVWRPLPERGQRGHTHHGAKGASLPHSRRALHYYSVFGGWGGGRDRAPIFVLGSRDCNTISSPVTQRASHDPGLTLGTSGPNHLRLRYGGPQPLKPGRVEPIWTRVERCGTLSRLAQLCRSVSHLSLIAAITSAT